MRLPVAASSLILVSGLLLAPRPAAATDLSTALDLEARGLLEEALEAFEQALRNPAIENTREELATIYLHLAMLRFGAGDEGQAREALLHLLAVRPQATLPDSAPPELGLLLDEAARRWAGRRLRADVEGPEAGDDESIRFRITVVDDLAGMVASAALVSGDQPLARGAFEGEPSLDLRLTREALGEATQSLVAQLLDEQGSLLWEGDALDRSRSPARFGGGGGEGQRGETPRRPLRTAGWAILGVGLASTAAGVLLLVMDGSETGERQLGPGYIDVEVLNTDGGGWAAFGLGLAAVITGAVLLIVDRHRVQRSWYSSRSGPGRP